MNESGNANSHHSKCFTVADIWEARKCSRIRRETHSTLPRESAAGKNKTVSLALNPTDDKLESGRIVFTVVTHTESYRNGEKYGKVQKVEREVHREFVGMMWHGE